MIHFVEGQIYEFYGDLEWEASEQSPICRALMASPCDNVDLFLIYNAAEYIYKFLKEK